jgi:hypothetical protein
MTPGEGTALASPAASGTPKGRDVGATIARVRQRVTGYRLLLWALLALALAFYLWTAATSVPFSFSSLSGDVYNLLTSAFLHGHTYLPITPPPGLLHLSDPYNPVQNAPYNSAYHDLALYHGHFYSAWGPTPVLTLFAPFRITGFRMSMSFAVAIYGFVGLLCAVRLLHLLVARFAPGTPRWLLLVATFGLALTNALPFLLRRPVQYEVAISCGYCFEMAGLLLVMSAMLARPLGRWRLAWGSLCLGLAVGGRPTLVVGGAVLVAAALWEVRRRGGSYRVLAWALGPFVVCAVLLATYNQVRFGQLSNFGDRYELAGIDQTTAKFYGLSYIVPGMFAYLFVPAHLALTFPHAFLRTAASDPFTLPSNYIGAPGTTPAEPTGGVFTTMPITLLLATLPVLWWRRPTARRAVATAGGLTILGLGIVFGLSWALFATTQRYEVDFASYLLIPAFLAWALLVSAAVPRSRPRRAWATIGVLLTLFGAAVGTAVSFVGYSDLLRLEHPGTFAALEDVTGPIASIAATLRGKPQLARIDNGQLGTAPPLGINEAGGSAWLGTEPVTLVVLSPGSRRLGVRATVVEGPAGPAPSSLRVRVSSPGPQRVTVPIIGQGIRLPVSLHWGLNRVSLALTGVPTSPTELELTNLQLGP